MGLRTVCGGNDFGLFERCTFGTDNEQDISQAILPVFVRRCYLKNCSGIFLFSISFLHQTDTLVKKWVFDQPDVADELAFVLCCGLALFWRSTCSLEIQEKVEQ